MCSSSARASWMRPARTCSSAIFSSSLASSSFSRFSSTSPHGFVTTGVGTLQQPGQSGQEQQWGCTAGVAGAAATSGLYPLISRAMLACARCSSGLPGTKTGYACLEFHGFANAAFTKTYSSACEQLVRRCAS